MADRLAVWREIKTLSEATVRSSDSRYKRAELATEASVAIVHGALTPKQVELAKAAGRQLATMRRDHGRVRNRYQP